ncbi:hypothetical protein HMI56_001323 [Coelomomyces lativittatus]|nr:hypothetical protein HMI56_001323 [Coelomomyces lativittatus]
MSPTSFQPHEPPRFTVERPLKRSMKKVSRPKKDASNRVHSYLADTTTLDISLPPPPKSPSSFSEMPFTSLSKPEEENEANEIFHNALSSSIDFQKFDLNDTLQSTHDLNPTEVMDPLSQSTPLFSKNQSSEASLSSLISGNLPTIHNDATLAKIGKNFHLAAYSAPELSTPSKPISPPLEKKEIEPLKKAKRKLSFFRMLDKKKSPLIHQAPQPTSTSTPVTSTSVLPSPSSPVLSTDTTLLTKDEQSTELTTIGPLKDKFTAPRLFSWLFHHTHFLHLPSSSSSSSSSTSSFSSSSTSSSSSTTSTSSTTTSSSSSSSTSFFKSSVMSTSKSKPIEPPLMLPTRYPLHLERALCRMSHQKLANPRRPLYHQVLISNLLVYWLALNPMALDPMVIPRKQKSKQKKKKSTLKKRSSSLVPNHAKQPYRNVPRVDMHQKESPSMSSRLLGASFVQTPPPPPSDNLENPHFSNGKREKKESMEDFRDNEGDIDLNEDEFENANGMEENDDDIEDEQEEQEEQEDDDLPLGLVMKNKKNKNSFES